MKNKEEKRKVAIYVRESTKKQAEEGYNIEVQKEKCLQYMKLKDLGDDYKLYREGGASAKTTNRKELNILKKDIKSNKISKLIVYKLDRLVRRLKGLSEIMELCELYKVDLISVKEDFDSKTLMGMMMINFTIMLAQWEQDIISERTIDALQYAAKMGSYIIGNKPPFGYEREIIYREMTGTKIIRLVPVDEEFEIVKEIYTYSKDGYNTSAIARLINQSPYMLSNKIKFDERRIENILSNKIYCGIMQIKGEEFNVDLQCVLSLEDWNVVQCNRSIHFKNDIKNEYPYKGKVYDEKGIICTVDVTNKKNKKGEVTKYYYYESPHSMRRINQNVINEMIVHKLSDIWNDREEEKVKEELKYKLYKCETLRSGLYKMYLKEQISQDIYNEELIRINTDIKYTKQCLSISNNRFDDLSANEKMIFMQNTIDKIIVNMETKSIDIKYC